MGFEAIEVTGLRVDDVGKASAVIADMRKIIRQDPRIIQKLHRRVFFDKLTREQARACYSALQAHSEVHNDASEHPSVLMAVI